MDFPLVLLICHFTHLKGCVPPHPVIYLVHFDMDVGQPIIKEDQLFCCVLHALVTLLTYAFPCMLIHPFKCV